MTTESLTVSLSGTSLSLLLYDNIKCAYSQEGFLIGELHESSKTKITDSDQPVVHTTRIVRINTSMACPQSAYFYDGIGRVDVENVLNFLGDLAPKVVAWFKYSPLSCKLNLTFREAIIHKQLAGLFEIPHQYFSFCILSSEHSDNKSMHTFTQTFLRHRNNRYEVMPMQIVNMSNPNISYKTSEPTSDTVRNIIQGIQVDREQNGGTSVALKIQKALQEHIDDIVKPLAEAEMRLFELEDEVDELKNAALEKNNVRYE
ncbi:hypothetical protein MTP99_015746 [Tenebrio molitor]|nr:hypothetical protein MTP99_015746 [Tenebrio molitor]